MSINAQSRGLRRLTQSGNSLFLIGYDSYLQNDWGSTDLAIVYLTIRFIPHCVCLLHVTQNQTKIFFLNYFRCWYSTLKKYTLWNTVNSDKTAHFKSIKSNCYKLISLSCLHYKCWIEFGDVRFSIKKTLTSVRYVVLFCCVFSCS